RKTCALPPAPVCAVAARETPALQRAFATGGRVNEIVSPAMGAPVSASSSRTLRPTLDDTPMRVVALAPSAETRVAGVGTMASVRRSGTTLNLNVTGPARRPGAVTTTWKGTAAGSAPDMQSDAAMLYTSDAP